MDNKITDTQFELIIEEIEDSFILNYTTGRPEENQAGCEGCGTMEDRPGFYDPENEEWMCAVCMFDPRADGKLIPFKK